MLAPKPLLLFIVLVIGLTATAKPFHQPFPFKIVRVLDGRVDSSIANPHYVALDRHIAEDIQAYIDTATRDSRKGDNNLLINIRELIFVKNPAGPFLLLRAAIYYNKEKEAGRPAGVWYPFIDLTLPEDRMISTLKNTYKPLLNKLIAILSEIPDPSAPPAPLPKRIRKMEKNKLLHLLPQTPALTFAQIDIPARARWAREYPALLSLGTQNGVYMDFYAFRAGKIKPDTLDLYFNQTDSTYHASEKDLWQPNRLPYVIARDGELFKLLPNYSYVKLIRDSATLGFCIPHSLPDMESLLKIRRKQDARDLHSTNTQNPLAGMALELAYSAVATSVRAGEIKHTQKKGMNKDEYRNCVIDMDTGAVMYR